MSKTIEKFQKWEKKAKLLGIYDDFIFNDYEFNLEPGEKTFEIKLLHYSGNDKTVTIPPVDIIYNGTFKGNNYIENIIISDTVKEIQEYAFSECINLRKLEIPCGVKYLGEGICAGCSNLEQVKFLNESKIIPAYAFRSCTKLKRVELPKNLFHIHSYAFYNCKNLVDINLEECNRLNIINDYALYGIGAEKLIIPENVYELGNRCFDKCENLKILELRCRFIDETYFYYKDYYILGENKTSIGELDDSMTIKLRKSYSTELLRQAVYRLVNVEYIDDN